MSGLTRIAFTLLLGGAAAIMALTHGESTTLAAENDHASRAEDGQRDEVDEAIDRAVAYLLKQQKDEGWMASESKFETAMTSLGLLALASVGHQPTDPTAEGLAMRRGLAFVLREDRQTPDGYYGQADASRMYGHGITTLMLTEMLGMSGDVQQDQLIRQRCQKAVELILNAQRVKKREPFVGGWRYRPDSFDADMSVTAWQVMALRSANNAGLDVPSEAIDSTVAFLKRSYLSPRNAQGQPTNMKSGFLYVYDPRAKKLEGASPAAGLLAMQVCGQYEAPEVIGASDWLLENPPKWDRYSGPVFYNLYYYSQGMFQRGGKYAARARELTETMLLKHQAKEGAWESPNLHEQATGPFYTTSLGVLALAVKYHYLPIYQR